MNKNKLNDFKKKNPKALIYERGLSEHRASHDFIGNTPAKWSLVVWSALLGDGKGQHILRVFFTLMNNLNVTVNKIGLHWSL